MNYSLSTSHLVSVKGGACAPNRVGDVLTPGRVSASVADK
jgi:hypothetical protein